MDKMNALSVENMDFDLVRRLLSDIEQGTVLLRKNLRPEHETLENHYGIVQFATDNGWILNIFFDCGEWDYIECVVGPNNLLIQYEDLPSDLMCYRPPEDVRRRIYKSPGYLSRYWNEFTSSTPPK